MPFRCLARRLAPLSAGFPPQRMPFSDAGRFILTSLLKRGSLEQHHSSLKGALLYLYILDFRKAQATRSWPATTGRVLHSRVSKHLDFDYGGGGLRYTRYDPLVTYESTVNGKSYQSHQLRVGIGLSTHVRREVERKVASYQLV